MKFISAAVLPVVLFSIFSLSNMGGTSQSALPERDAAPLFGFHNSADETALESRFLAVPDPTSHGEAQVMLATQNITTNTSGNRAFAFQVPSLSPGMQLTATAAIVVNNATSEFSTNVVVVNAP